MLDKLDRIDWKNIKSGFELPERIPQSIRDLTSTRQFARNVGISKLGCHIYREDRVFESTPLVVSCLVALLADEHTQDKHQILGLLDKFADPPAEASRFLVPEAVVYYLPTFEIVAGALDIYLGLLKHDAILVRQAALRMVRRPIFLNESLPKIERALLELFEREPDADYRSHIILTLTKFVQQHREHLPNPPSEYASRWHAIWQSAAGYPVPQAAAISLAQIARSSAPQALDSYLADLAARLTSEPPINYIEAVNAIWQLGRDRGLRAMIQSLNFVPSDDTRARYLSARLLAGLFKDNPMWRPAAIIEKREGQPFFKYRTASEQRSVADLTHDERQAVQAVIENDMVWRRPHNLLAAFGLPADRDTVRKLLG